MTSLTDSLKECGAIKFGDFTLASGKKSKYYIDIKKASASPRILKQIAHEISDKAAHQLKLIISDVLRLAAFR